MGRSDFVVVLICVGDLVHGNETVVDGEKDAVPLEKLAVRLFDTVLFVSVLEKVSVEVRVGFPVAVGVGGMVKVAVAVRVGNIVFVCVRLGPKYIGGTVVSGA